MGLEKVRAIYRAKIIDGINKTEARGAFPAAGDERLRKSSSEKLTAVLKCIVNQLDIADVFRICVETSRSS
jgi:hypothetical protein